MYVVIFGLEILNLCYILRFRFFALQGGIFMQKNNVNVERTVYVDNKLKKIYQNYDEYQLINEADQEFFDQLFSILWIEGHLNKKNEYLGARFGYQKSTIEKKLRHLERAHLIYRDVVRKHDDITGRWTTDRDIFLDEIFKAKLSKDLKLAPAGLVSMPEPQSEEEIEEDTLEEVELPIDRKRKGNPKFDFSKIRR